MVKIKQEIEKSKQAKKDNFLQKGNCDRFGLLPQSKIGNISDSEVRKRRHNFDYYQHQRQKQFINSLK